MQQWTNQMSVNEIESAYDVSDSQGKIHHHITKVLLGYLDNVFALESNILTLIEKLIHHLHIDSLFQNIAINCNIDQPLISVHIHDQNELDKFISCKNTKDSFSKIKVKEKFPNHFLIYTNQGSLQFPEQFNMKFEQDSHIFVEKSYVQVSEIHKTKSADEEFDHPHYFCISKRKNHGNNSKYVLFENDNPIKYVTQFVPSATRCLLLFQRKD
jgi:hypothetical protein